jgi:sugar transferase EpsL
VCDIAAALVLVLALAPVLVVIGLLVRAFIGSPIIFRQRRTGFRGQIFTIYKFRTMTNEVDQNGILLEDAKRITACGLFLRRSSLDELPELINVLIGDMSIVGPRPLLPEYLERYSSEQARRHLVPPGITGWSQINGRNDISWEEKLALDVWYVDNQSAILDAKILARTVYTVLSRRGISKEGYATSPEFMGSSQESK